MAFRCGAGKLICAIFIFLVASGTFWAAQQATAAAAQNSSASAQETSQSDANGGIGQENSASGRHDVGSRFWDVFGGGENPSAGNRASPYVPLDSWIYPALERLEAMGLVNNAFAGMRPWTRMACAQMILEAEDVVDQQGDAASEVAGEIVDELSREFEAELEVERGNTGAPGNTTFRVESLYSRTEHISGMPLTDGYHFAQTQFNDFGRPYGEGWSTVNGFSAYASYGRWVAYVRGEGQTAPSIPPLPLSAREMVAIEDYGSPTPPATPRAAIRQFALLDTYIGVVLSSWELSFGRQSMWWGPGGSTSLELSDNIQPIDMIRLNRTTPWKLPSFLGWLGPIRTEFFLGRLSGYEFMLNPQGLSGQWGQSLPDQPFINGQNISFRPTSNFEFGFYRTTLFSGQGYPFTFHALGASLFDLGNTLPGKPNKPGKRTSGLDVNYRLPGIRDWATIYADGYINDEFSPVAYPTWSAWHSGLYFSHLPGLPRLDLRAEGVYTDVPKRGGTNQPGAFFSDVTYRSGYTNNGYLIGSWIGRGAQGAYASSNYWFNARSYVQVNFRHQKVSKDFVMYGGTLTDVGVQGAYWFRHLVGLSASVQYERWLFPIIQAGPETDVAAYVEVQIQPQKIFRPSAHNPQDTSN